MYHLSLWWTQRRMMCQNTFLQGLGLSSQLSLITVCQLCFYFGFCPYKTKREKHNGGLLLNEEHEMRDEHRKCALLVILRHLHGKVRQLPKIVRSSELIPPSLIGSSLCLIIV